VERQQVAKWPNEYEVDVVLGADVNAVVLHVQRQLLVVVEVLVLVVVVLAVVVVLVVVVLVVVVAVVVEPLELVLALPPLLHEIVRQMQRLLDSLQIP